MPKPVLALLALLILPGAAGAQGSVEVARAKVYPALVNITVVMRYCRGGRAQRAPGAGSGVIVSPQGHVITNYHVAGNTTRIMCTLRSGEQLDADVVGHDVATDLSVLKLRVPAGKALPSASLGDSSKLVVGQQVIAMGNPLTLSSSLSVGVVSNTSRVFTDFTATELEEQELDSEERTGMFTRWIQHDALILPGNSGGPLVNLHGEVVGINELGGNGMGFAIPSNTVSYVYKQILAHKKVQRGWLGVSVLPVSKLGRSSGALISAVTPESPAEKLGLQPGDVLTAINGAPVTVRHFEEVPQLYQQIAELPLEYDARISYERAGAPHTATAKIVVMPKEQDDEEEVPALGVTVRGITRDMAASQGLVTRHGVLVTGIRPGYALDQANPKLQEGDIVTSLAGAATPDVATFRKAAGGVKETETPLVFYRRRESIVTGVKVTKPQQDEDRELPKAWLGVKTQVVTPAVAKACGQPSAKGFRVTLVYVGTQAQKAGLQEGDILTSLNGSALEAARQQDAEDLKRAIEELTVGETIKLGVLHQGKPKSVQVKLEATPTSAEQAKKQEVRELEFTVRDLAAMDRMEPRWQRADQGVLVIDVTAGGWAHMAGLRADDIVLAIKGKRVDNLGEFETTMKKAMDAKPRVIDLFVRRGYSTHFVFIEPDWSRLGSK